MTFLPQKTIKYKTYIKTAIVEGLKPVFAHHVDEKLQNTKVGIAFPKERQSFPSVVVQLYEKEVFNSGVGHEEKIVDSSDPTRTWRFKHYFYKADIELKVYALSALDRDLISDTLVQVIAMGDLATYTNNFFNRIYPTDSDAYPDSAGHFINVNSDKISPINETEEKVPWNAEDDLIYSTSYRIEVFGEFYSLPEDFSYQYISNVFVYPYVKDVEPVPPGLEGKDSWKNAFSFD